MLEIIDAGGISFIPQVGIISQISLRMKETTSQGNQWILQVFKKNSFIESQKEAKTG